MRKYLLTILSLSTVLFANNQELVNQTMQAYKARDWKNTYYFAEQICKIDCSGVDLNLIIGQSATQLGLNDEALAAFDRVLIYDENNIEAQLQSALIYKNTSNIMLLQAQIESLIKQEHNLNDNQKRALYILTQELRKMKYEKDTYGLYASISAGVNYDKNPKKGNNNVIKLSHFFGNLLIQNSQEKAASSYIANFNIGYLKNLNDSYNIDLNVNYYHKKYFKPERQNYSNLDVATVSLSNTFTLNEDLNFNILSSYDYSKLLRKKYLSSLYFDASLSYNIKSNFILSLGSSYQKADFLRDDLKDDNYKHISFYGLARYYFSTSYYYLKLAYDIEKAKEISQSLNSDYKEYQASLGAYYLLLEDSAFKLDFTYYKDLYKKYSAAFDSKRKDDVYKISNTTEFTYSKHISVQLDLAYQIQKSNQALYSYENYLMSLIYRYKF